MRDPGGVELVRKAHSEQSQKSENGKLLFCTVLS